MVSRRIWTIKPGQEIRYNNTRCLVTAVYPYTAYLKTLEGESQIICACIGDLVISGIEPSIPLSISQIQSMMASN